MTVKELAQVSTATLAIVYPVNMRTEVNKYGGDDWATNGSRRYNSVDSLPVELAQATISFITAGCNNDILVFLKEG